MHVCIYINVVMYMSSSYFNLWALAILQYSVFGSILTIGAMIGAVVSGRIADYIGRRGVSFCHYPFVISINFLIF